MPESSTSRCTRSAHSRFSGAAPSIGYSEYLPCNQVRLSRQQRAKAVPDQYDLPVAGFLVLFQAFWICWTQYSATRHKSPLLQVKDG